MMSSLNLPKPTNNFLFPFVFPSTFFTRNMKAPKHRHTYTNKHTHAHTLTNKLTRTSKHIPFTHTHTRTTKQDMLPSSLGQNKNWVNCSYITGVAKVRPSKDFLRPLCQILDVQLSYL